MTVNDQMNGFSADSKAASDCSLALAKTMPFLDCDDVITCEFFGVMSSIDGVLNIRSVRGPNKVSCKIIQPIKVNVMHLPQVEGVFNKSRCHNSVNEYGLLRAMFTQDKVSVTPLVDCPKENSTSLYAANVTKVRDFVKSLVSGDWFPLFCHAGQHTGYCPMIQARG